jgi:hypothetical protein
MILGRLAFLSCLLAAAHAQAPARAQAPIPAPQKPLSTERLVMPLFPNGWTEAATNRGNIEVLDYVPQGETLQTWRNRITLEVYHELNTLPLDALQRRAQGQNRDSCEGSVEGRLQSGLNNGFPSAFWTLGCKRHRESGMGETRYSKAIQGNQRLYILTRAWRTPAFGDDGPEIARREIEDAVAFLTATVVCADGDANHPCPAKTTAQ